MGETLTFANEQGAYPLTDKGTFLAFQADLDIVPLVTGGDILLNRYSAIAAHIDRLPLEPELEPAREEYLQGVREIRDAGSFLWRGAATLRAGDFRSAETAFMSGEEHINAAYRMLDMGGTGPDDRTLPPPDPYPEALSLGERYTCRDESGANNISVIIDGEEYAHITPERYVREISQPYGSATLERKEVHEGFLISSIPEEADPSSGYIRLDLGEEGKPVWRPG